MTRFARAKGSKASNERREEDATPWHVMRQQLANQLGNDDKVGTSDLSQIVKNVTSNHSMQGNEIWSNFEEIKTISGNNKKAKNITNRENNSQNYVKLVESNAHTDQSANKNFLGKNTTHKEKNCKNLKMKDKQYNDSQNTKKFANLSKTENMEIKNSNSENDQYANKQVLGKNKKLKRLQMKDEQYNDSQRAKKPAKLSKTENIEIKMGLKNSNNDQSANKQVLHKNKKIKRLQMKDEQDNDCQSTKKSAKLRKTENIDIKNTNSYDQSANKKVVGKNKSLKEKKHKRLQIIDKQDNDSQSTKKSAKLNITNNMRNLSENSEKETVSNKHIVHKTVNNNRYAMNPKTFATGQHVHENYYNPYKPYTIIANGREIQIVRYDGFLVKKDDAVQLKTLRKRLRSENIPTDKIKAIMKLERRKAEKALAREKNTVCFHCRKFGHNFADCPDIKGSELSQSGICFKCGSTEHTHFECKVSQNQNFRFAVCFVCKEQGHIARQCTLNPQGQYPKGGSCHLCGEVTHLRKDCPKATEEKPTNILTINRLESGKLEDIEEIQISTKDTDKKKTKIVTF